MLSWKPAAWFESVNDLITERCVFSEHVSKLLTILRLFSFIQSHKSTKHINIYKNKKYISTYFAGKNENEIERFSLHIIT